VNALCEQRTWPCETCTSLADFDRLAEKSTPRAVVVRQRLSDGYSDDILASLKRLDASPAARVIILVPADCSIQQEARQVKLGADGVFRDPVRLEVLLEYLARYRTEKTPGSMRASPLCYEFARVQVFPHEHRLVRAGKSIHVAPQEIGLLRLLSRSAGKVLPYPVLYSELFHQRFSGETANSRVLLGKITTSFRRLGVDLRRHIEVIPKSGYLYSSAPRTGRASAGKPGRLIVRG
jgi:two-component system KDP operon response regulator KdpE